MSSSLRLRIPLGLTAAVGLALIMACDRDGNEEDDGQFRRDVIWCEEAVAHLEECCGVGVFDATKIECRHYYSKSEGCGNTSITRIDPAYTTEESECIRDLSCDVVRERKVCERALAAGKARVASYDSSGDPIVGTSTSGNTTSSTSGSAATGPICP